MAADNVITYLLELEDKVSAELKKTAKNADALEAELKQLKKEQKEGAAADERRKQTIGALKMGFAAAAAAAAAVGAAFVGMGAKAVGTSANLEGFETRLGVLLGGLDKGKQRVDELFKLSASTPFSINGLVEADASLEAFGVNASRVRGGVMDLAGATGMELTEAANAVGKALAGGAGAADVLREKGVIAMVEVQAGMTAAEMTTEQFREALINTLETNQKIAGGTALMAETFDGLMSTLKDQFTVFSKQVGDADLFSTAKATLKVVLDLLGENSAATGGLAQQVGQTLAGALVSVVDMAFKFAAVVQRIREGFATVGQVITVVQIGINEMHRGMLELLSAIPGADMEHMGASIAAQTADIAELNLSLAESADHIDEMRASQDFLLTTGEEAVRQIGELATKYQAAADASKDIAPAEGSDEIMTIAGIDAKALKQAAATAKKAEKDLESFEKKMTGMGKAFRGQAASTDTTLTAADKLRMKLQEMADKFGQASVKAQQLGPEGVAAFEQVKGGMIAAMSQVAAAADQAEAAAKRAATAGAVGAGMSGAADIMSTGGMGMLASAGPVGAGAASLIGIGQQGQQAFEAEVQEKAAESAADRQAEMQARADKLTEAGATDEELAAAGLSAEDIAAAGEVTEGDIAAAEEGTDRGQVMAEQVKAVVEGVIEGIGALLEGLPDILSTLIPMLLVDLPLSLIDAIPALIEELIPVLLVELPQGLLKMLGKLIPKLVMAIFVEIPKAIIKGVGQWFKGVWNTITDFFSFGFQTGGFVPKTSSYLLHQGERVVPASGAGSGTASKGLGAFNAGGKSLTVNTQVVHPDSIHQLGKLIDDELGAHGRTTVPIFGDNAIGRSV